MNFSPFRRCRNKITGTKSHISRHICKERGANTRAASWESVWAPAADAAGADKPTFAVVGEMEQKGLKTAGVGPELVPDDLAEEDDGNVVLHLKTPDV